MRGQDILGPVFSRERMLRRLGQFAVDGTNAVVKRSGSDSRK
jgi:hypothetical protein